METVGFGVVGLGMGRLRAGLIAETQGATLEGVCDINEDRLKTAVEELHCKGFSNYEDMLSDDNIDVVYVLTPSGTHLDFVEKAAMAGKHIIVTKPMEVSVERCHRVMQACESNDVHLIVDFQMRYKAELQQWKAAMDAGEFGDVIFAEVRCKLWRDQAYYEAANWRGTWQMDGGGSMANQGIHAVDLFVWLCGEPQVIAARCGAFGHQIEAEDVTVALLDMPNGRGGVITTTTCHHLDDEFGVAISGTLGSASNLRMPHNDLVVKFEGDGRDQLKTPVPSWPRSAAEDMVRVLRDGMPPHIPGEEGIRSSRLMEVVYDAACVR